MKIPGFMSSKSFLFRSLPLRDLGCATVTYLKGAGLGRGAKYSPFNLL